MRNVERISCKIALFNRDRTKVLLVQYGVSDYGLPGGHIEKSESPLQALKRELFEELGIKSVEATLRDSWRHPNGKIILGYTGLIDETTKIIIDNDELVAAEFVELEKLRQNAISAGTYDKFILQFCAS